jgi:hypothetical protein
MLLFGVMLFFYYAVYYYAVYDVVLPFDNKVVFPVAGDRPAVVAPVALGLVLLLGPLGLRLATPAALAAPGDGYPVRVMSYIRTSDWPPAASGLGDPPPQEGAEADLQAARGNERERSTAFDGAGRRVSG